MTNSIDQQFIEYVVKSLVGNPDAVSVERRIDEKGVLLELTVDPEDLGRVIGKRGATAQSLRTLLRALGTKNEARYNLKIIDNGTGPTERAERPERPERTESDAPRPAADPVAQSDDSADAPVVEEETTTVVQEEVVETPAEDGASERLQKAREELADLDDLDI